MKKILAVGALLIASQTYAQTKAEIDEIRSRLDNLETESILRNFKISGNFINTFESLNTNYKHSIAGVQDDPATTNVNEASENQKDQAVNLWGTYIGLNVDFDINDRIKFYSTLAMSKLWNADGRTGEGVEEWNNSWQGSYAYRGSEVRYDRAFMSYQVPGSIFNFSIGRMPTNNGPVQNQLDALERTGTYPRFAINAIFDGLAVSTNLTKFMPKDHSLKTRLVYSPFQFVNPANRMNQATRTQFGNDKLKSDSLFWAFLTEYELKNLSFAKSLQLYGFFYHFEDFFWQTYNDIYGGILWNGTVAFEGLFNSGLNFSASYVGSDFYQKSVTTHTNGNGYLFNLNYKFESTHVVGAEYIVTERNHYIDDWTYLNMNDFYKAPKNTGAHLFWSMPIYNNLRLRLGTFQYKVSESSVTAGRDVASYYSQLRLSF